jgi:hypothetical protein
LVSGSALAFCAGCDALLLDHELLELLDVPRISFCRPGNLARRAEVSDELPLLLLFADEAFDPGVFPPPTAALEDESKLMMSLCFDDIGSFLRDGGMAL